MIRTLWFLYDLLKIISKVHHGTDQTGCNLCTKVTENHKKTQVYENLTVT